MDQHQTTEGDRASGKRPTLEEEDHRAAEQRRRNKCVGCQRPILSGEFFQQTESGTQMHLRCVDFAAQGFPGRRDIGSLLYSWRELRRCIQAVEETGRLMRRLERRWCRDRRAAESAEATLTRAIHATRTLRASLAEKRLDRYLARFCYSESGGWWVER